MSSYNNRINTQNIPKEQQNAQNQTNIPQDISNFNTNKANSDFQNDQDKMIKTNKISKKKIGHNFSIYCCSHCYNHTYFGIRFKKKEKAKFNY